MKLKILTHQRNFYKYISRKLKIYAVKETMHWRKLRNLKKQYLSYENLKENHAKFKYYTGINVEVFDCLFDCLQAEKDIEAVKKTKKRRHRLLSYRDQLIMTLIKLRLNTQFENLADQVGCSKTVELIRSSFTKGKKQLSAKEVEVSRQIALVRIHVKRVIGLIKNRYKILDCVLPLTLVKTLSEEGVECEIANIDKLFTVCAVLVNLGEGIVYNEIVNNQD